MKRIFYLIIFLGILQKALFGQVNESKEYVYFFTDSVIYGNVDYKKPFFGPAYLKVDSLKIQLDKVKFYKNQTGFFANSKNINFSGTSSFSERIRKGRINLFEKENINYSPGQFSSTGMYMGGSTTKTILNYYNKGFGELKKADYKNLSIELADNPESLIYLNKFKSVQKTQNVLYAVGGALFVAGFATLVNKTYDVDYDTEPSPNVTSNLVAIGLGAGCFLVSYTISFSKPEYLRDAVDAYNK
jgi:hypothetical protein